MRSRRRRALIVVTLLVMVIAACALFNLEGMRATYWAERAASCGVLTYGVGGLNNTTDTAQRMASCFAQAASHCRAVVLRADTTNVDSGATFWFLVEAPLSPLGACEIAVMWSARSIHAIDSGSAPCRGIARLPTAMRFTACGSQGDITLPIAHGAYLSW